MEINKLYIGASISHQHHDSGTLGAFVLDRHSNPCLISCNHVLAQNGKIVNKANLDTCRVFHPGNSEEKKIEEKGHVAHVANWQKLVKWRFNRCDAAYAKILTSVEIAGNHVPFGPFEGKRIHVAPVDFIPHRGMTVHKIGQSTGFTTGVFSHTDRGILIGGYRFSPVLKIEWKSINEPFSINGDSGSLVFTEVNRKLYGIGMIFAGVNVEALSFFKENNITPYSYACTLGNVLKKNKVSYL